MLASRLHMPSIKKALGARLKQLREEQSLRVEDVAQWVGIDRTHIYSLERGDSWPSVEVLISLATVYRVDPADLFVFPEMHLRHRFRELARLIPNAKLASVVALTEEHLGITLEEMATPQKPAAPRKTKTK